MRKLTLTIIFLTLATPSLAEGKTSRANIVTTPYGWCMIKAGGGIGCHSAGIPAVTDGYAWMTRNGRVHLGDSGGLIGPVHTKNPPKLRRGDRWIKRGITCRIPRGLVCRNKVGHGFALSRRDYWIW